MTKPKETKKTTKKSPAKGADAGTTAGTTKKKTSPIRDDAGRFLAGHKKMGGRKPGTPNKATKDARSTLGDNLLEHLENVGTYLQKITDPAKKIAAIASLLPFYMPRYQSTTLSADTQRSLSCEEQMLDIAEKYTKKEIEITIKEKRIINFDDDDSL